jgi:hypothetical protein
MWTERCQELGNKFGERMAHDQYIPNVREAIKRKFPIPRPDKFSRRVSVHQELLRALVDRSMVMMLDRTRRLLRRRWRRHQVFGRARSVEKGQYTTVNLRICHQVLPGLVAAC